MLNALDIKYLPWTAMKWQILVDLVAEFTKELGDSEAMGKPKKAVRVDSMVVKQQAWQLFVDGAAN